MALSHSDVSSLLSGQMSPETYFHLVVSSMGHDQARDEFLDIIQVISSFDNDLHEKLTMIYLEYFTNNETSSLIATPASSYNDSNIKIDGNEQFDDEDDCVYILNDQSLLKFSSANEFIKKTNKSERTDFINEKNKETGFVVKPDGRSWIGSSLVRKPKSKKSLVSHRVDNEDPFGQVELPQTSNYNSSNSSGLDFKAALQKNKEIGVKMENLLDQFSLIQLEPCAEPEDPGCFGLEQLANEVNVPVLDKESVKKRRRKKKGTENDSSYLPPGLSKRIESEKSRKWTKPTLYWIRKDLRLYDNIALTTAVAFDAPVIPTFIWSEEEENSNMKISAAGGATKVWLHEALKTLTKDYGDKLGSRIIFRKSSSTLQELKNLISETGAANVVFTDAYEPWLDARDNLIESELVKLGINVERCDGYCLYNPKSVSVAGVGLRGLGSVSHFMTCCKRNESCTSAGNAPLPPPTHLINPQKWPMSHSLESLGLAKMPKRKDGTVIDWAAPIRSSWDFSEEGGFANLQRFLSEGVKNYNNESGRCDLPNTSQISPYLRFGQISPKTVLYESYYLRKKSPKYLRKLAWRDLAYWLLWLYPSLPFEPLRPAYYNQRWSGNKQHLKAWQKGFTGYPLVDAAMRQLWATGWCNNYARHIAASFLIAYLHIHWIEGYLWYQDTLVDADVAINAMMWQNGGMSGPDHWNFVMHPVNAALTCDPKGDYVRRYVPELANLPDEFIHQPWKAPQSVLKRAGVRLGSSYPDRVITDLEDRREQSLEDVAECRRNSTFVDPRTGCDLIQAPPTLMAQRGIPHTKDSKSVALFPVITRKEFKFKTLEPDSVVNPFDTVLKGYVSRARDEAIQHENTVHLQAAAMQESVQQHARQAQIDHSKQWDDKTAKMTKEEKEMKGIDVGRGRGRRQQHRSDPFSVVPKDKVVHKQVPKGFYSLAN